MKFNRSKVEEERLYVAFVCVVVELDEFAPPSIEIWKASLFQLVLVDAPVRIFARKYLFQELFKQIGYRIKISLLYVISDDEILQRFCSLSTILAVNHLAP